MLNPENQSTWKNNICSIHYVLAFTSLLFKRGQIIKLRWQNFSSTTLDVHCSFSVGFFHLLFCLDNWPESFLPDSFSFGWPEGTLPPALNASDTSLIHLLVVVVLFYLLGPEIEEHCKIKDLIPCSWNVLASAGKSCHQSDDTCSKDNCFQRGRCPASLFLPSIPRRHFMIASLFLAAWFSTTSARTHTFFLSFKSFFHVLVIHWSHSAHLIFLRHLDTHFHLFLTFLLPHSFTFSPNFKTADLLWHMLETFFVFFPFLHSPFPAYLVCPIDKIKYTQISQYA